MDTNIKLIAAKKERLDKFLAGQVRDVSRSKIQKAIKAGFVLVNSKKVSEPDFQLKENDQVELPQFEKENLKPFDLDLKVVFENEDLAVIDKPAGLVVHPGAGNPDQTLANVLLHRFAGIEKVGDPHRPGIVHRLDENTSGLIVIAKNQASLEYLKNLFFERKIEKEYLTLVHGVPAKKHEIINASLEKVPLKQKMSVRDGSASGGKTKQAITEYFVLETDPSLQFALLRVKLHTGRTHQIRAHLAHIGHPIVGDQVYGKPDKDLINRQFLHAYKLKFQLQDGTWLELESELPEDLKKTLVKLAINIPVS